MKTFASIITILFALATLCASHEAQPAQTVQTVARAEGRAEARLLLSGLRRWAERARTERECNLVCPVSTVCSLQFIVPMCVPVYRRLPVPHSYLYSQTLTHPYPLIHGRGGFRGSLAMHAPLATVDASNEPIAATAIAKGQATFKGDVRVAGNTKEPVVAVTVDASHDEPISSLDNNNNIQSTVVARGDSDIPHVTGVAADVHPVNAVDAHFNEPVIPSTAVGTGSYSDIIDALVLAAGHPPSRGTSSTSNTVSVDMGLRLNNCGYVPPECRALHNELSTAPKYTFDYTLGGCVLVNVCSSCSLLEGARFNLFDSPFDCARFCE